MANRDRDQRIAAISMIGVSLVIGLVPQLGYAFGLSARSALVVLRSPRKVPIGVLGKHRSIEGI